MLELKVFLEDRHQDVDTNGNPNLSFYGIAASPEEVLDAEVLFDPFEEQLDAPATFIE